MYLFQIFLHQRSLHPVDGQKKLNLMLTAMNPTFALNGIDQKLAKLQQQSDLVRDGKYIRRRIVFTPSALASVPASREVIDTVCKLPEMQPEKRWRVLGWLDLKRQELLTERAELISFAAQQNGPSNPLLIKLPGVNQTENPFPDWLRAELERNHLQYNAVNFCYQGAYTTLDDAEKMRAWFDSQVRPWILQEKLESQAFVDSMLARVTDESIDAELAALVSY